MQSNTSAVATLVRAGKRRFFGLAKFHLTLASLGFSVDKTSLFQTVLA